MPTGGWVELTALPRLFRWCDGAGNVAVGNLPKYLPLILAELRQQPKRQYLLLSSLREVCAAAFRKQRTVAARRS